jgi:alkanesulfonate monooxygenase SsuD/methylene tetrahydromethanopterin reductase-like flavin-dependent oxidoreductase (luciferase family)
VYGEVLEQVELANDLGFDTVLFEEEHFSASSSCASLIGMIGAAASSTQAIRIGPVKALPLDNPAHVAEDYAVLDLQLNGRLIFGVGPGEKEQEFRAFGIPFAERWERFIEFLDFITKAWTHDAFSYGGRYFRFPKDTEVNLTQPFRPEPYTKPFLLPWERGGKEVKYLSIVPKPVQIPHPPVWVGTDNPEAVRFAARRGYAIVPGPVRSRSAVVRQYQEFAAALREAGREIAEVERPLVRDVYVAEEQSKAVQDVRESLGRLYQHYLQDGTLRRCEGREVADSEITFERLLEDRCLIGDPDQVFDQIKSYQQEAGINHILCRMHYPGLDHVKVLRSIRLFAAEVITRLRS